MCGICGVISTGAKLTSDDYDTVNRMTSLLRHRGPDQQKVRHFDMVSLGNTRLAVIDKSNRSSLPLSNHSDTVWLCYNGEVSNFKELRQAHHLDDSFSFKGESDSEVVLHLYEKFGISFLSLLTGMFAFCLFDQRLNKVYLVRDFFGINPLFYHVSNQRIYFASEIKSLLEVSGLSKDLNQQAFFDYYTLGYLPGVNTPYVDICELRGGELIEIDLITGSFNKKKYYNIRYETNYTISLEEASDQAYLLLKDSVRRNLISDASIGSTLSGGIDTSGMVCLAKELGLSRGLHTFSIKMGESSFDESKYQRIVSKFANTEHHEFLVNQEDVIESLYEHVAYLDEPLANGAPIPSFILSCKAKPFVSVLLSGEGGDEVFSAYDTHKAYKVRNIYKSFTPSFLRKFLYWYAHLLPSNYKKLSFDFMMKRFTEGAEMHPAAAHIYWRHPLTDKEKESIFRDLSLYHNTYEFIIKLFNESKFEDPFNRISFLDVEHYFVDDLLVKNDRMFMAHSVETRFPMMDRFLFEFMSTVPSEMRIKGLRPRFLQKHALRNTLPPEILRRKSFGLEMPHSLWFFDKLRPIADKYFTKEHIERSGLYQWRGIEKLWHMHLSGKKDYGRGLWSILIFLIWHEMFIYDGDYKKYYK